MSISDPAVSPAIVAARAARAEAIRTQAIAEPMQRLWRAALGAAETVAPIAAGLPIAPFVAPVIAGTPARTPSTPAPLSDGSLGLGRNQALAGTVERAAARTGLPAAALAAIVDAEAAKNRDGSWKTASRNPRSSAGGLTQFLAGSWIAEAERAGTYLNGLATANGWLAAGRIRGEARRTLLDLRFDATAAIEAAADYARYNLDRIERAGVAVGTDIRRVARLSYLAHHLGTGDAIRYLKGGLDGVRAGVLLAAQVGQRAARERIESLGNAAAAHRSWLEDFVERRVDVSRFLRP